MGINKTIEPKHNRLTTLKKCFFHFLPVLLFILFSSGAANAAIDTLPQVDTTEIAETIIAQAETADPEVYGKSPVFWSVIPFALLLILIATGPLFFARFWHNYYPHIAVVLGLITLVYYVFILGDTHHPIHSLAEYFSFISLLTALFVASGGILIKVNRPGTPLVNTIILVFGAALANLIGTTGASMVLIRPFIRLNRDRIRPFHVVFFIFLVSNMGGCLTPIGDPPLFLGFLKGVPFFWTVEHLWLKWFFGVGLVAIIFYVRDTIQVRKERTKIVDPDPTTNSLITLKGSKSFIWLGLIILLVFIDPNILPFVPGIEIHGEQFSFIREILMLAIAFFAYKTCDKQCMTENEFNFAPIREVAFLFIGIFATMMPALHLISDFASSETGSALIGVNTLYWFTGGLSGVLDNAPTYLNFLAAGMGKVDLYIGMREDVLIFTREYIDEMIAISISAVFFGAATYIGNAPNFMVKSIAEESNIQMPSFVGYIVRFSIPFLLPVFILTWLVFFIF